MRYPIPNYMWNIINIIFGISFLINSLKLNIIIAISTIKEWNLNGLKMSTLIKMFN